MLVHAFNPSIWESEAGGSLILKVVGSAEWVTGHPWLHSETLSWNPKPKRNITKPKIRSTWCLVRACRATVFSSMAHDHGHDIWEESELSQQWVWHSCSRTMMTRQCIAPLFNAQNLTQAGHDDNFLAYAPCFSSLVSRKGILARKCSMGFFRGKTVLSCVDCPTMQDMWQR